MVHYIRFLKPPQVTNGDAGGFTVTTLITIETDLGDDFLHSEAKLDACVIVANEAESVLHRQQSQWRNDMRHLVVRAAISSMHEGEDLRLHVASPNHLGNSIAPILDAWSAPFRLADGCRADLMLERRFLLPHFPPLKIWEETGNSIAKHIW